MTNTSELVDQRIRQLGDWRAETRAKVRRIILAADHISSAPVVSATSVPKQDP